MKSHPTHLPDHILTYTNEEIKKCGLINFGLSDHQMTFCTRKIKKKKQVATNKFHLDLLKTIQQISIFKN